LDWVLLSISVAFLTGDTTDRVELFLKDLLVPEECRRRE